MSTKNTQSVETRSITGEIRRAIHAQFFSLGQYPREIGRRYGMSDREVVDIAREVEHQHIEKIRRVTFADGRRSLISSYARKAGLN